MRSARPCLLYKRNMRLVDATIPCASEISHTLGREQSQRPRWTLPPHNKRPRCIGGVHAGSRPKCRVENVAWCGVPGPRNRSSQDGRQVWGWDSGVGKEFSAFHLPSRKRFRHRREMCYHENVEKNVSPDFTKNTPCEDQIAPAPNPKNTRPLSNSMSGVASTPSEEPLRYMRLVAASW